MKFYEKPEVEEISLIAREDVTTLKGGDIIIDGDTGVASSEFG